MSLARRGTWLAVAILAFAALSQWLPESLATGFWRWLLMLWLIAVASEAIGAALMPLQMTLRPRSPLRLGRPGQIDLELSSRARRRLAIRAWWPAPAGALGEPAQAQGVLAPGETLRLQLDVTPTVLGSVPLEPVMTRQLGRFRLAWWTRRLPITGPAPATVPDLLGLSRAAAGGQFGGRYTARSRGVGGDVLGLRDYSPGDPLRAIAWKAVARSGRLTVRDFSEEQHLDVMLVLDVGRAGTQAFGSMNRLGWAVNMAARLAERAALVGDRVGLIAYDAALRARLPLASGRTAVRSVRAALAGLRASAHESDPARAALAILRECRVRALVVWFTDVEAGAQADELIAAMRHLAVKHLPVLVAFTDEELDALACQAPQEWKDPYVSLAAQHQLERTAQSLKTLQRLGCEVVEGPAERLDRALVSRYLSLRMQRRI